MSAPDRTTNGHARPRMPDGPIAPPQNLEAEQSVLGAVLLSDTALPALIIDERLHPDDFYREAHGVIYAAMLELNTLGEPIDALTLVEHLKQAGKLDAVGGRAAVDALAASLPGAGPRRAAGCLRAGGGHGPPVRAHRARERDAPPPPAGVVGDPGACAFARGTAARPRRPRRARDPRGGPRGQPQGLPLDPRPARCGDRQARAPLARGQVDHRHRL